MYEKPFWGYRDLLIFIVLAVPCALIGLGIAMAVVYHGPWHVDAKGVRVLVPQFVAYALMLAPLSFIFGKYDRPVWHSLGWTLLPRQILPAMFAGLVTAVTVLVLGVILRTPDTATPMHDFLRDPVSIALVCVLAVTFGPMFEEIFFRGLLQPLLVHSTGVAAGIFLTSLPFALLHGGQYAWSWRHLLLILLASCSFGWMRYRTGSTAFSTVMHGTYNLILVSGYLIGREAN